MQLVAHACEPGWEKVVCDELQRVFPGSQHQQVGAGWLESRLIPADLAPECPAAVTRHALAFTRQCLPQAVACNAPSINGWAKALAAAIEAKLDASDEPWRLHIFNVPTSGADAGRRRNRLIEAAVREALARRRKLLRRLTPDDQAAARSPTALVQAGLVTPASGYVSALSVAECTAWQGALSHLPGGVASDVPRNLQAPSRAFAKLVEALERFGRDIAPGETCVDLGASPGGWTYVAVQRGARVTAVDRSPLDDALMKRPGVAFVKGDAFAFQPPDPVDWLLSDVVAFPPRVIELLERWLTGKLCRRFIVTVKFRGDEDYPLLEELKQLLARRTKIFRVQRMANNKNEATAWGEV